MAVNVSEEFKQLLEDGKRNYIYYADIELKDGTQLSLTNKDIWQEGFRIEDAVSGDDDFQVGSAIIGKFTLILNNMYGEFSEYDFSDAKVNAAIGLQKSDGSIEKVDKGVFTVDDPHSDTELLTLECLDNMSKFDRPYSESTLIYPATRGGILLDACQCCGVILNSTTFPGSTEVVQKRPDDDMLTFRQVVAWIAQLSCKWARCNKNGHLELGWYDEETLMAEIPEEGKYHDIHFLSAPPVVIDNDVVITGVQVVVEDTEGSMLEHFCGSEGYVLSVEGNELIEPSEADTVAATLGEKLIGLCFRPIEVFCLDNPAMEAGDVMIVQDWKGNKYRSVITRTVFTAGAYQKISCGAESPAYKNSTRYSETTKTYVALRKLVQAEKTARELAVENLANTLKNSSGLHMTKEQQEDGSYIYYMHNKPTLGESGIIWKLTAEAFAISTDGGETWPYGFTVTGEMITRLLYAEGINADYIDAGALTVKDKSGKIVFQANMNTGQVIISGDHVSIGDKSATQAIQDALDKAGNAEETAANAKNMAIALSNDYQSIPVDAEGNYSTFPECSTVATVMYGSSDITSDCVFTVTNSIAITGSWDNTTKTYTVTGLAADSGWVDIKATYLGTLVVTKRLTVAKLYAGATGDAGKDAILLQIASSNGNIFKNSGIATTLTVTVIVGDAIIDCSSKLKEFFGNDACLEWYRKGVNETIFTQIPRDDPRFSDEGFIFTLNPQDVLTKVTFNCGLIY